MQLPIQAQPIRRTISTAKIGRQRAGATQSEEVSFWECRLKSNGSTQGSVTINWGHTEGDAEWACNNWISSCGNNGGCYARGFIFP